MPTLEDLLHRLRVTGWSVAVHNDYRLNGKAHTFWLFTHDGGRFLKGEGETDTEALTSVLRQTSISPSQDLGPLVSLRCEPCGLRCARHVALGGPAPNCLKCGRPLTRVNE